MVTYVDEVTLTGGTTTNVAGTAQTISLNSKASRLLALITSGCDTALTQIQGHAEQLILNSSSLSISDQRFLVGPYVESQTGANSNGQGGIVEILPFDTLRPPQGNEAISLAVAPTLTQTAAASVMTSLMYCDQLPPADWRGQFPLMVPVKGGYTGTSATATTTRTALTAINIPTWANEIVGVKLGNHKSGAQTAAEYVQTVFEITSTIPDVTPMKLPSNSEGPGLGTQVGPGQWNDALPAIPIYIDLPGGTQTITPYVNLVLAVTGTCQQEFCVYWR
jgi:hypothetical protein